MKAARRRSQALVDALEPRIFLSATLRIASYNINADTTGFTNQSAPLETVLEAMGADPLNDNGVMNAQPLDVLGLEELANGLGTAGAPTLQSIVANLNATYGAGTYSFDATVDPVDGKSTGNGPSGLVYNTQTIQVISAVPLGTDNSSGAARDPMMYLLQPVGYPSSADFYFIVSHMKSGSGTTNANRRNVEAETIVNTIASLPANSHVIVTGDFNPFGDSGEPAYQTLRGTLDDPGNPAGNFVSNATFASLLSESATADDFRDDIQFVTPAADSGAGAAGIEMDASSLNVFGNGGAATLYKHAVASTSNPGVFPSFTATYRTTVLNALETNTDHLPILADYSLVGFAPQVGSVTVNPGNAFAGSQITATAANVTDSAGTVTGVSFALVQGNTTTPLGAGVQIGSSWALSFSSQGLTPGAYSISAVANDSNGASSAAATRSLNIVTPPPYVSFSSGAVYTWDASSGNLNLTQGEVDFTADQATSGDVIDPLVNLTATGPGAAVKFESSQHMGSLNLAGGAQGQILEGSGIVVNVTSLGITGGSALDVTADSLAINFGSPALDPEATIAAYLASGYNGGAWNGPGIRSFEAADNPGTASVGYIDGDKDVGTAASANQVLVAYCLPGDSNLDGSVGFADLIAVAQNFGFTGADFAHGNLNYDPAGSVGFADLILVAQGFGASVASISQVKAPTKPPAAPISVNTPAGVNDGAVKDDGGSSVMEAILGIGSGAGEAL